MTTATLPPPRMSAGVNRLIRTLQAHSNTRLYLAHAARGRYAVVAETSRPGRYRLEHAVSAATVGQAERAGLLTHDEQRENRIDLGEFSGRRHLDGREGERVTLTDAGRAYGRPRSSTS